MGRQSKQQEAETIETYLKAVSETMESLGVSAERTLNLIAEEGIWLALSANTFLVLGNVGPNKPIEYAQRKTLVCTLRALTGAPGVKNMLKDLEVSIPNWGDPIRGDSIKFKPFDGLMDWFIPPFMGASGDILTPNQPLQIVYGFIQPVVEAADVRDSEGNYLALPIHYRVIVSLLLPGIIRSLVDILAQRSTLVLG